MLNTDLLPRPFSSHKPRVKGYSPIIRGKVERINRRKRLSWRWSVSVDDTTLALGHEDTKVEAESFCARMMNAYTEVHYINA